MKLTALFSVPTILVLGTLNLPQALSSSPYTWVCEESRCLKKIKNENVTGVPMTVCKLNCDEVGSLWPKPTGKTNLGKDLVSLYPSKIELIDLNENPEQIRPMLTKAFEIFKNYLSMLHKKPIDESGDAKTHQLQVAVNVTDSSTEMDIFSLDESYNLTISTSEENNMITVLAEIRAVTFFGARHGLETLSQLIAYDNDNDMYQIVSNVTVEDKPVFPYRGIHVDTSRNYLSVKHLEKIIDGMSYNKLNVFHWHITDTHSFPMEVPSRPKMLEYGAYTPDKVYKMDEIRGLITYAKQRGVKIIPELDQPAHSGYGYQWGALDGLGDLVVCLEHEPWYDYCVEPPCGQLNIVNDNVTLIVGDILKDMLSVFDTDIFHMGGDEVDFRCYNSSKQITDWMLKNNYTTDNDGFTKLWGEFQEKLLGKVLEASQQNDTKIILWNSGLTNPEHIEQHLDKDRYIIQYWSESTDTLLRDILQKGYKMLFSNVDALYLDCGFPAWIGDGHNWCSPMKGWQTIYDNDPEKIYSQWVEEGVAHDAVVNRQIIGAEAALWSEQSDEQAMESRYWPRGGAHAERVWSHPKTNHTLAEYRMVAHRNLMVTRGIAADSLQPEFCLQNEGKCYGPPPSAKDSGSSVYTSSLVIAVTAFIARLF